jgi:hypothetical protein
MVDSVTRAHGGGLVPLRSLSAGEKLRRAGNTLWGGPFRDGKKHSEPHDRQQGETDLHGRRGTTRRGGEKPRGRHAGGTGCLAPKGAVETRSPGVGLPDSVRWRGDLWKPQERQSGRQAGPQGSGRDGRVGVKVRRDARACLRMWHTPVVRTSRATVPRNGLNAHALHRRSRRGAAKPRAAESIGDLPPCRAPEGQSERRETASPRESALSSGKRRGHRPRPWPLGAGSRAERSATPLKTRRTTYPPAFSHRLPRRKARRTAREGSRRTFGRAPPILRVNL